jgi:uncharacterized damage-inducible protein DinB
MTAPASYGLRNLRMLARYTQWADEKLFAALRALPEGTPAQAGRGFGSMISTLNHSLVVDEIWRAHLEARQHGHTTRNTATLPSLEDLAARQAKMDAWFIAYADALTEAQAEEVIHFKFVDGGPGAMTRGDMLLHVINHKTYHRGFVSEMIFQLPVKAPMIDLPVYLRDAAPRAADGRAALAA